MVLKGQFLERPTLIPLASGLVLEGLSHRGTQPVSLLVLPPAPAEGSGMDHVVGAELAFAVARHGFATLRFNYRGVGGSQGEVQKSAEALFEDALAALELALDNARGQAPVVAAIGASDAVALKLAAQTQLAGVALVNPSLASPADLAPLGGLPRAVVLAEHDDTVDRSAWAQTLSEDDGALTVVPGASRTYQRNLPLVGKAIARLMARVAGVPLPANP